MSGERSKKFQPVDAPKGRVGQDSFERIPQPERWRYQWFGDAFTRMDSLLEATLKALNVTIEQHNFMIAQNDAIIAALGGDPLDPTAPGAVFRDYLSEDQLEEKDVLNLDNPVEIEVLELLGRRARYGFIYSETGTLDVKFNDGSPIPVKAADFLNISDLHLEVEKLRLETLSAADITFRLLLL